MLQPMGLQRVGHDGATEQQQMELCFGRFCSSLRTYFTSTPVIMPDCDNGSVLPLPK